MGHGKFVFFCKTYGKVFCISAHLQQQQGCPHDSKSCKSSLEKWSAATAVGIKMKGCTKAAQLG
jgi:hypothetical protein